MSEPICYGSYSPTALECRQCLLISKCRDVTLRVTPTTKSRTDMTVTLSVTCQIMLASPALTASQKLMIIGVMITGGRVSQAQIGRSVGISRRATISTCMTFLLDQRLIIEDGGSYTINDDVEEVAETLEIIDMSGVREIAKLFEQSPIICNEQSIRDGSCPESP